MNTGFSLDFCEDYIWIRHPVGYRITLESQERIWTVIGEACRKYNCPRVLAESPEPPERSMSKQDALKSAKQAACAASALRMACLFPGYEPDETTDFFINVAYNSGIRIELFSQRGEALEWLGGDKSALVS